MRAKDIREIKKKIKTWKIWWSRSSIGFSSWDDVHPSSLATRLERKADVIIYGETLEAALRREAKKQTSPLINLKLKFVQTLDRRLAKVMALPNRGLHLKSCPWNLNSKQDISFWE